MRIVLVTFAITLLGCTKVVNRVETLGAVTVPETWKAKTETLSGPVEGAWWRHFEDNGLDQVVKTAVTDNLELRAASARVAAAIQDLVTAKSGLYPALDFTLSNARNRQNFIGFPIPGQEDGEVRSTISTNASLRFGISWELDLWGRVQAGKIGAIATVEARRADLSGAWLSLTGQAAKAWFAAVEANRQVGLGRASVASFADSEQKVRARFEMGLRPALDLRLALTELRRSEATLQQRLEQRDRAIRQLEILLGGYPSGGYPLGEDLPYMPATIPAGLPAELVHRRPDIVSAERSLYAANARLHQSKADLKPRFALTATYGSSSPELQNLLNTDLTIWNFIQNLTLPIFSGGRLRAAVDKNEALIYEAAASYENLLLRAYSEVESALAAEDLLAEREKMLEAATQEALAAQRLSEERYRLGLTDIITLLSAQRTAINSEAELIQLRRQRLDNRVDLHLALGGGFQSDISNAPTPKVGGVS